MLKPFVLLMIGLAVSIGVAWPLTMRAATGAAEVERPEADAVGETETGQTHSAAHVATYEDVVVPFIAEYCINCHGPDRQRGNLRLDDLGPDMLASRTQEQWEEALRMLSHQEMPPENRRQPSGEDAAAVIDWIAEGLQEAADIRERSGGRMVIRRLNRREYTNTIRDLVGVEFDAADLLPPDSLSHGFDTIGSALSVSTLHIERYAEAAREIVHRAIVTGERPEPIRLRGYPGANPGNQELPNLNDPDSEERPRRGVVRQGTPDDFVRDEISYLQSNHWNNSTGLFMQQPLPEGEYVIRVHAGALIPTREQVRAWANESIEDEERREQFLDHVASKTWYDYTPPRMRISNVRRDLIAEFDVDAPVDEMQTYEVRTPWGALMPSEVVRISNNHSVPRHVATGRWYGADGGFPRPELAIKWFEIEGPVYDQWPPASHRRIFFDSPDRDDEGVYARQVLERFMERAYRRPVASAEVEPMLRLYEQRREHVDSLEEAMKAPLVAILCSPHFLYMVEPRDEDGPRRLDDYEIATRLSYFLWSSMPDDELFDLAAEGRLQDKAVVRRQMERMLADERSEAFTDAFASHWLELRRVGEVVPDERLYPEYDDHLQESMREEGSAFFAEVLHEDLSVLNFVASDFVVVNERLAQFYEIPGVRGDHFRRVEVNGEAPRGGVLTMAGVHTVTSNGSRTSPVLRGVWVLENLLNNPPPPAPPDVGEIPEAPGVDEATVRERLQAHRQVAQCASCHNRIDPLGFAMENFNAIGKFRSQEGMGYQGMVRENDPPIDASGRLPDGRSFEDLAGLQQILLEDRERFVAALSEKMLTYALGRPTDYGDREVLEHLADHMINNGYSLRGLIGEIVVSEPFLSK